MIHCNRHFWASINLLTRVNDCLMTHQHNICNSGASLKRDPFWNFTREVIEALESVGLKVLAVTTDMGPANTGLWNHVGIQSTRTMLTSAVAHPCAADRSRYFVADPPHLLKNLWSCILAHEVSLSSPIVSKYNLPIQCRWLLKAYNSHDNQKW